MRALKPTQWLMLGIMAVVGVSLYLLPRGMVAKQEAVTTITDSSKGSSAEMPLLPPPGAEEHHHHEQATASELKKLEAWKKKWLSAVDNQKKCNFADSISAYYLKYGQADSAFVYARESATLCNKAESALRAGDAAMEAFNHTGPQNGAEWQKAAEEYYQIALKADPQNEATKRKLAKAYVNSPAPMRGVKLLKQMVEENPKDEESIFTLGYLSIQSGQFDKAVGHFENLVTVNPKHAQGWFYLGFSLLKIGKKPEAASALQQAAKLDQDPEFQSIISNYLNETKN
jgi:tetratricopeptide (TPR) repeat protein